MRTDGRTARDLRPVKITPNYIKHAEGSALIEVGDTRVICTVSVEHKVPHWMKDKKEGWVTSEYGMIPRATGDRAGLGLDGTGAHGLGGTTGAAGLGDRRAGGHPDQG